MFELGSASTYARNLGIYAVGVGLAVVGALGMAAAIELSTTLAVVLLTVGLALVVSVHEYFDGPL